jgi:hypothetical protein
VETRFTNFIRSWRLLVTRNYFCPMVSYLIIYKQTTKHNQIQEKARRIRAGMCTERKLHSNWRSPAGTPSLSPTVVVGLRVRYSRHRSSPETFFFSKNLFVNRFVSDERRSWTDLLVMRGVREPICSWWEAFENRGSTVLLTRKVRRSQRRSDLETS